MDELEELIASHVDRINREQAERVEDDLRAILGRRAEWPASKIARLGYEVVYQKCRDDAVVADYRGIRRRGKWVIDHYPHWPQPTEETPA